ncbi:preprotein translocase subunit SecE [bacterium]|nr:preprotein translocase subunit SecE [bacterium]MCB1222145.1 preprotein translocase subunit SecE [bacterium]UNM07671.1 MAG: preprotein translocase subunit SecE [Planctomycetales bacterium]
MANKKPAKGQEEAPQSRGVGGYVQDLRAEWNKITFPDRKDLTRSTISVFLITGLLMGIIVGFNAIVSIIFQAIR